MRCSACWAEGCGLKLLSNTHGLQVRMLNPICSFSSFNHWNSANVLGVQNLHLKSGSLTLPGRHLLSLLQDIAMVSCEALEPSPSETTYCAGITGDWGFCIMGPACCLNCAELWVQQGLIPAKHNSVLALLWLREPHVYLDPCFPMT